MALITENSIDNIFDYSQIANLNEIKNITTKLDGHRSSNVYFSTNSNHLSAKFFWNIIGPRLEVYSFEQRCNNRLVASFDFSQSFNDSRIIITNVDRLVDRFEVASRFNHPHKLIVVLSFAHAKNYICIVDIRLNNIVSTIEFPFNVTSLEVVLSGPKDNVENMPLIEELCCMNGCLAVGCEGGLVFFIDLILDSFSPEPLIPKKISMITPNRAHMEMKTKRRTAIFHNQVICIGLNIEPKNKGKFNYRADDGTILASFLINQVYISALHYIPQLSLICIGYNFGGFHLYNLNNLTLECCCNVDSDLLPVISFTFQAPENDPKNYSYLWLIRGVPYRVPNVEEVPVNSCSTAFVYLLCYKNKKVIKNYGILYDTFKLCCCKFELPLVSSYQKKLNTNCTSRLLDLFTIQQLLPISKSIEIDEEVNPNPIDYNYLVISWETMGKNRLSNFYFCIFDLNQWYKSQMPKSFCLDNDGLCPFISIYSLNSLTKSFKKNSIQTIYLPNLSLIKFTSNMFYSDIHSYPASLSFQLIVASESQIANLTYRGVQKSLISYLNSIETMELLEANFSEIFEKCLRCGLISGEVPSGEMKPIDEKKFKLFQLMNVALENNLNSLMMNFIQQDFEQLGINLKLVLEWIWYKVESIKKTIDILTKPLFDLSGCNVSQQEISKLVCYESHLGILKILLKQILENSMTVSNLGFDKLKARIEIVELLGQYLKFILLFENFGLLPDQSPECNGNQDRPIYSYEKLSNFYCKRREELISSNPNFFNSNDVLLIDILVKNFDSHLSTIWKVDENNTFSGLYPPQDLASLLKVFLLDSIPLIYKESLLLYFIYDLSDCLSEYPCLAQKLLIFISSLDIQQGVRNFIEGLWFLDHQSHEPALQLFTHPMVTISLNDFKIDIELFNKLIQRIMELFLFENQYKKAMILTMSCNHVLLDREQNENLYIQILLLDGHLSSAFEFQRHRRAETNSYHLLYKLFFVCEKMNTLIQICRMPLDEFEENVFVEYLLNSSNSSSKMILVLYYLMNNKIIEAIKITKQFQTEFNDDEDSENILNLINAYDSILPSSSINNNLAKEINHIIDNRSSTMKNDSSKLTVTPVFQKINSDNTSRKIDRESISTPAKKTPLYLSPGLSRSKIIKQSNKQQKNSIKKLFEILKTPDMKKKFLVQNSNNSNTLHSSTPMKKPILKLIQNDSDLESISGHKLKVSFRNENDGQNNSEEKLLEEINTKTLDNKIEDRFSTPTNKKSRMMKRSVDSPSHRMTLRSNKKN